MNIIKLIADALGITSNKKLKVKKISNSNVSKRPPNTFRPNKLSSNSPKPYEKVEVLPINKANIQPEDNTETPPVANYKAEKENLIKNYRKEIDEMSDYEIKSLIALLAEDNFTTTNDVDLNNLDPLFDEAARLIVIHQQGSTSLIQRKLKLGYNRSGRLIDQLESARIVGPFEGANSRDVLISDLTELEFILKKLKLISPIYDSKSKFYGLKNSIFYEKYKTEIEEKKLENILENEKKIIRDELIEKNRKRQLKREVMRELKHEGIVASSIDNGRKRESIPQEVKDKVWNRDSGKCVKCDSQENLEFDHIIPFSKGGSNTYKNLQILCKSCNIEKSNKIG